MVVGPFYGPQERRAVVPRQTTGVRFPLAPGRSRLPGGTLESRDRVPQHQTPLEARSKLGKCVCVALLVLWVVFLQGCDVVHVACRRVGAMVRV